MEKKKVVIPYDGCPKEDIISYLREILSQLHWSNTQCVSCDWVDYSDDKWHECCKCGSRICKNCCEKNEEPTEKIFCHNCDSSSED